jgi:sulfate transport system permease protein
MTAAVAKPFRWREPSILPGFPFALGFTVFYVSIILLVPMAALAVRPWELGLDGFIATVTSDRALAAFRLSFGAAAIAAGINAVMGLIVAWALVRYDFPGKGLANALVDLPFALPTSVAGIALTTLYAPNGLLGAPLAEAGIRVAYTPLGVILALIFVGLPFVVRSVQPVLEDVDREVEEAALTLGAGAIQRAIKVILPAVLPALISGVALAFARAVGEYGSVIFIAGNMPMVSEIAPLMIITKLEQYDYPGATAIALAMLALSFTALLILNLVQNHLMRRMR